MKNIIEEDYKCYDKLDAAYYATDSEAEKESIRKALKAFKQEVLDKGPAYNTYFWAYAKMKLRKNDYIDFSEVIWEDEIPGMVEALKNLGFDRFSVSSNCSGMVETAWIFEQNGCTLEGIIEINSAYKEIVTEEFEKAHAFLFRIN